MDAVLGNKLQRAISNHQKGLLSEAHRLYLELLIDQPGHAEALNLLGVIAHQIGNYQHAVALIDRAIGVDSLQVDFYSNRGNGLKKLKQYDAAIASFDEAIGLKADFAAAYSNRGIALYELKQFDAAITSYDQAICLKPDFAEAYSNRGNALQEVKQYDAAITSLDHAIAINGELPYIRGIRLHLKMIASLWDHFDDELGILIGKIESGEKASTPFPVLSIVDSPAVQRKAATIFVENKHPQNTCLRVIDKPPRRPRIRIGYYSADFGDHVMGYLMAEFFERQDKNLFELYGISFGLNDHGELRQRISKAFDRFVDVRDQSDQAVAQLSRSLGIDIAIDLMGYTDNQRTGIFSYRAAPIQVNYLGFPGTMAAEYIDYVIADRTLIPKESQKYYSEKIAYLPNSYKVNYTKRAIADKHFSRAELGIPNEGFVFCCFNNNYKITPTIFDCWMRILHQVQGSVLWLLEDNPTAVTNLRKEANSRGVHGDRLIFANRMPLAEHLARHRTAELFLDTLPYNAHTTASDALWVGLPLITCMGESFASRVAASLLTAIGLPELITTNLHDYESLAVKLATHPEELQSIKNKLERQRSTTPLFDVELFTKNIEDAYFQMYERYQSDLPPEAIYLK